MTTGTWRRDNDRASSGSNHNHNEELGQLNGIPAGRAVATVKHRKSSWVRLRAPHGIGGVQTYSGRSLTAREDGTIEKSAEDAKYFIRDGWTKLAEGPSVEDL
jgi:hypothetical protein